MSLEQITGCILGTAIGDAIGLPYEQVPANRVMRLLGPADRHRFLLGKGMVSDDTEHTCMVAQELIASRLDPDDFRRQFAKRMRWWFAGLPIGFGRATILSSLKLWAGISPENSGVFSAGNGPAMRSAILGVVIDDSEQLAKLVRANTRISHRDPKAEYGALAIAVSARMICESGRVEPREFMHRIKSHLPDETASDEDATELLQRISAAVKSVQHRETTKQFAEMIGCGNGISGYSYHTVPACIHAWLSNQSNYAQAIQSLVICGGDVDTTAAITGGLVGTHVGKEGIPQDWIDGIWEWPRTVDWMERLAAQLHQVQQAETSGKRAADSDSFKSESPQKRADVYVNDSGINNQSRVRANGVGDGQSRSSQTIVRPLRIHPIAVVLRNVLFLLIVLLHAFRRLFPPYAQRPQVGPK